MNNYYDRGFNSVLPFHRSDAGKPCGNSYIPADKECRAGQGKPVKAKSKTSGGTNQKRLGLSSPEAEAVKSTEALLESRRRKVPGYDRTYGYSSEGGKHDPTTLGIDTANNKKYYKETGFFDTQAYEADREKVKQKIIDSRPKGYFNNDWTVEDEHEYKNLLKLKPDEYERARANTIALRRKAKKRAGAANIAGALVALGITAGLGYTLLTSPEFRRKKDPK